MYVPKTSIKQPAIKRLSNKDWLSGTVTARDDARTPIKGLRSGENVQLNQDGTIGPRPSLIPYGPQPTGTIKGQVYEYKKVSGSTRENWLISLQSFGVSRSPSASLSPSSSVSFSASESGSVSPSASTSPSGSRSPSSSASSSRSPSASVSPSSSASGSPSASLSPSASTSRSPSSSLSPSASASASTSAPITAYGQIYIAKGEDISWTAVTGKFYDPNAEAHFVQIGNKVVIMNGVDNLSYLDITSATVIPFVTLSNPSAPTLTTNNVGGTGFNVYYRITANSTVGETAASNALTVAVDTDRDLWNPPSNGGTDNVIIAWTAVSSAVSYNVYLGTVSGSEYLIASGVNGTSFTDDGTFAQDTTRLFPTNNSTAGPKSKRGEVIASRLWLVGDADDPYLVRWGGDFGHELDLSPANGGGYVPVGSGTKDIPIRIIQFRDGRGNEGVKVLCQGTNGLGKRFTLTPDQLTIGSTVISFYGVTEDAGQDGTDAPDAVVFYQNSLWYPSRDGFKTTGTLPQLQNVLSTSRVSATIQPDMKNLNSNAMGGAVGLPFEGRIYWALPVGSSFNNQIWTLDIDRKGAWMKPWSITADWLLLYNDNSGYTHFLVLSDNQLCELSYTALTSDNGHSFQTSGKSGQIYFSDDKRMWVQLLMVIIVILRPQGTINFTITGRTEDNTLQGLGEPTSFEGESATSVAGWGEPSNIGILGFGRYRWSGVGSVPESLSLATQEVAIEIDEEIQWVSYEWVTNTAGVDYDISDIIFEYIETGIKDLA